MLASVIHAECARGAVDAEVMAMPDRDRDDDHGPMPDLRQMPGDVHPWVLVELARLRRDTDKVALRQSFADASLLDAKASMRAGVSSLRAELKADISGVSATLAEIRNGISKVLWVFVSAFLLAFAAFVVRGGLNLAPPGAG